MLTFWVMRGWAQDPMSLKDAVHMAIEKNKSLEVSAAAEKAAESRVAGARSGFLPSDNPVFVFSSLRIKIPNLRESHWPSIPADPGG